MAMNKGLRQAVRKSAICGELDVNKVQVCLSRIVAGFLMIAIFGCAGGCIVLSDVHAKIIFKTNSAAFETESSHKL